jgi:hypothetical protein
MGPPKAKASRQGGLPRHDFAKLQEQSSAVSSSGIEFRFPTPTICEGLPFLTIIELALSSLNLSKAQIYAFLPYAGEECGMLRLTNQPKVDMQGDKEIAI